MKCPKCGFFGPDGLDLCKKCGKDLSAEKAKLGLTSFRIRVSRSRELIEEEPSAPTPRVHKVPEGSKVSPPAPKAQIIPSPPEPEKKKSPDDFDFSSPLGEMKPDPGEDFSFGILSSPEKALDDFEFPAALEGDLPKDAAPEAEGDDDFSTFSPSEDKAEPFALPEKTALLTSEEIEDILKSEMSLPRERENPRNDRGGTELLDEDEISKFLASLDHDPPKPDNNPG